MDLVARSGDLKRELVAYAQRSRFERALRQALDDYPDQDPTALLDHFILQRRLPDGRTVVERFVDERADLAEPERKMLLGWRDVVEGIFDVQGRDGEALVAVNIIDELTYQIRSNMGPAVFKQMPKGSFLVTRLVPVEEQWLFSGLTRIVPKKLAYQTAAQIATTHPAMVFRNPEKVAKGWELQREDREQFVAFFGADLIVLPGAELGPKMRDFYAFRIQQALDRMAPARRKARKSRAADPAALLDLPDELTGSETVAVVYDEVEGLSFYAEFATVEAVFADPRLASIKPYRQRVMSYLKDDSVSPLPFRRLAHRDPDRASKVFQTLLKQPKFSWERDGDALLRRYKRRQFETPALPRITPISDTLAAYSGPGAPY